MNNLNNPLAKHKSANMTTVSELINEVKIHTDYEAGVMGEGMDLPARIGLTGNTVKKMFHDTL